MDRMLRRFVAAGLAAFIASGLGIGIRPAKAVLAGITVCSANTISVSNSSSAITLSSCGPVVIIYNITSQEAFYNTGATATTSNYSIPGNSYVVLQVPQANPGQLSAITASSTTTLRIVQGIAQT
jgi:hypothetical protein